MGRFAPLLLLAACSGPAPEYSTGDLDTSLTTEQTAPAPKPPDVEHFGEHTPARLCVGLLPSYVDFHGEAGLVAAERAVNDWTAATGAEPIGVGMDGSCGITVEIGERRETVIGSHKHGRIILTERAIVGECTRAENGAYTSRTYDLQAILMHELGHAFGCPADPHVDNSPLMAYGIRPCQPYPIDAGAVECATRLK